LFVGKYQNDGIPHFSVINNPVQLLSGFIDTISVCTVDNKNKSLGACVVVAPKGPDFVLPSNVLWKNKQLQYRLLTVKMSILLTQTLNLTFL